MLLEWTPFLRRRFLLYDMGHVNTFIICMYGVMACSLPLPNLVAFYAKLNEIQKNEFHFALEVSISISYV